LTFEIVQIDNWIKSKIIFDLWWLSWRNCLVIKLVWDKWKTFWKIDCKSSDTTNSVTFERLLFDNFDKSNLNAIENQLDFSFECFWSSNLFVQQFYWNQFYWIFLSQYRIIEILSSLVKLCLKYKFFIQFFLSVFRSITAIKSWFWLR